MPHAMTLNVRIGEVLGEHVMAKVGDRGMYDNVSEYVRDLIRKDREQAEEERFHLLKAELQRAFATPDSHYVTLTAEEVIRRNAGTE
jgi:antitoxin ParD1/3/4